MKLIKSFLIRILIFNVLLVSLIIFVLSAILYFNFESIGINIVSESILDRLYQTSYSTAYMQDASLGVIAQVYMDDDITAVLNAKDLEGSADLYKLKIKLQRIVTATNFVESISVYDGTSNHFFSTKDYSSEREKEFLFGYVNDKRRNDELASGLHPIPRIVEGNLTFNKTEQVPVYSYIMYNNYTGDTRPEKGVILNVKEDWMRNVIKSAGANYLGDVFILNQDSIVMSDASQDRFLKDLSDQDYVKEIFVKGNSGYFITNIDNICSLVTFVSSDHMGWKFISVLPYSAVVKDMEHVRNITFLMGLAMLLLGVTLSYILARKVSFPINRMKQKVSEFISPGNKAIGDIEYITNGLDEAANNLHTLKMEKDMLDKGMFLRNLLLGRNDMKFNGRNVRNLAIDLGRPIVILAFKIDDLHEVISDKSNDLDSLKRNIGILACMALSSSYTVETVDTGDDQIVLLMNSINESQIAEEVTLNPYIDGIQKSVTKHLAISITAVVGCISNAAGGLAGSYQDVTRCFEYRLVLGHKSIITHSYTANMQEGEYVFPENAEKKLIEALRLCRREQAGQLFSEIVRSAIPCGINAVHSAIIRLAITVSNTAQTLRTYCEAEKKDSANVVSIVRQVSQMETLEQIASFFSEYFQRIIESLEKQHNTKMTNLACNVKRYIEANYMDPTLSLKSIAGSNHISSAYLGKLFKDIVGESVAEYINQIRMKEALKLISDSSITINSIIEKTGNTSTLFFRYFKKTFGITPNEYRKNNQKTRRVSA